MTVGQGQAVLAAGTGRKLFDFLAEGGEGVTFLKVLTEFCQ